jgi:hypothetical protein
VLNPPAMHNKQLIIFFSLISLVLIGTLAAKPPKKEKLKYRNLQVLSKNISDDEMDYVMETFSVNLGSNCLFCHPGKMVGAVYSFDYATDQLQNKRVARDMLRMTLMLNKKYFNFSMKGNNITKGIIWCKTCHNGSPVPILPQIKKN